jgi:hypothetical protein
LGHLEAGGKCILDIRYPGCAASDLRIVLGTGNAETYGSYHAIQHMRPSPGGDAIIVYQD